MLGDGTEQWVCMIGASGADSANGIVLDSSGDVYVTGSFVGSMTLGSTTLTSQSGNSDAFIVKLTGSGGTPVWAKSLGSTGSDAGFALAMDSALGSLFVTGQVGAAWSAGSFSYTSFGSTDAFIAQLDTSSGNFTSAIRIGGSGIDVARGIDLDKDGEPVVAGYSISPSMTIGYSSGFTSWGSNDAWIAGLSLPLVSISVFPG
jgi:hypothetical protein